jgi:prepilin-type N-terminal cleavage/methylation domain-containing protein
MKNKGFTLIEVMVVMVILVILVIMSSALIVTCSLSDNQAHVKVITQQEELQKETTKNVKPQTEERTETEEPSL